MPAGLHAYRSVAYGVERLPPRLALPRHRHTSGYATVVLGGAFIEASFAGRFLAEPGDVLLHGAFDCHANEPLTRRGPHILRLPWFDSTLEGRFRVPDPDALVRLAERDPLEATRALRQVLEPIRPAQEAHWTERLASTLARNPQVCLRQWAEREGIAPETLSRGFHRKFGVHPKLFRLESRVRQAWVRTMSSNAPLTTIAHELQFADLAHMSRSIALFTGCAPSRWRMGRGDPIRWAEGMPGNFPATPMRQVRSSTAAGDEASSADQDAGGRTSGTSWRDPPATAPGTDPQETT